MRRFLLLIIFVSAAFAQDLLVRQLPADDLVRIKEFYRLAASTQEHIWPGWENTPSPLLLVTPDSECLTHHPSPPKEFAKLAEDLYCRPRQFPQNFQATFPAFGFPPVIVIGEPANTLSKSTTPWMFTVMHEHFHQLQWAQPGYLKAIDALDLSHGDTSGMWMLNYPFPYEGAEVTKSFSALRDLLLRSLAEQDQTAFGKLAAEYVRERAKFFAQFSSDDHKYFSFQLWQEGIARYTEVKSAEAAAQYRPTDAFAKLADYEPFSKYAEEARQKTLSELKEADLATWKRTVVYSFGAAEGFLLDRINPRWKEGYLQNLLSTDMYFETGK